MIAKGNLHSHGQKLGAYLITGKKGERAELIELRGFATNDVRQAFMDVQIAAEATRCERPFFHAHVRLPEGEQLSREQWLHVADRIEKRLGFEGQGRAVAFHHQRDGETHLHVAWSRIDLEQMRAIDPGLYKNKLKEVSRALEKELGLTRVRNERDPKHKTLSAGRKEFEQSRRLGTDIRAIREDIRACWERSDSGKGFAAALDEKGYILARGDQRDFVVVDPAGGDHALGKRILGVAAPEIRGRMGDLDKTELLSVDQAKGVQEALGYERSVEARETGIEQLAVTAFRDEMMRDGQERAPAQGAEAHDRGIKSAGGVASGLGDSTVRSLGAMLDFAADFISPPKPPTKEQARRQRQANAEKRAEKAARDEKARRLDETNEMIRATRARTEEEERERAREHERQRQQERERER